MQRAGRTTFEMDQTWGQGHLARIAQGVGRTEAESLPERRKAIAISCLGLPHLGSFREIKNFRGHIDL